MWYCWLASIYLLIWNQYLRHCSCQSTAERKLDQSVKLVSKNHHATCDVDVLESCVYLSTFLILALNGGDWSPAPIGQDMVVAKWIYSCPYWESNSSCVAGSLITVYNYSGFYLIILLYSTLYCKGHSGSNASAKVSHPSGVTSKGNLSHIVCCSWAAVCCGVQLVKCSGLHGVGWLESKHFKPQAVTEFLIYENAMSNWNSLSFIGFLWWRYCVHKYCALLG